MSEAKRQATWTWEAHLDCECRRPIRHELVDGQVHAMGGGTAEHDTIGKHLRAGFIRRWEAGHAGRTARTSR
jgi:hypothetical protein